ncbi:MAG: hypothetical protein NVS1B4_04510 [Gemmatimonadaceae bacterium]
MRPSRQQRTLLTLTLLALILPAGCGRTARARSPDGISPRSGVCCTVTVDNKNWQDVVVYVVHNGTRTRLGTVTAASQMTFAIRAMALSGSGSLRFLGHPIGVPTSFLSEAILVQEGQAIVWELESGLERSMLSVR